MMAVAARTNERLLFGRGVRGELVRTLQTALVQYGTYRAADVDGDFGGLTAKAVRAYRRRSGLPPGQDVDPATWTQLTGRGVPSVRDRALQLTAAFEGHGFTLAQGNFDGAGVTWGVIGFTLSSGELSRIVLEVEAAHPELVRSAFRNKTDELLQVMRALRADQLAWADPLSLGASKARLAEPWRTAFWRFGSYPEVQAVQLRRVDGYFDPAVRDARALGLKTELGVALCFDVHVQNGSISSSAMREIEAQQAAHRVKDERELRILVAHAVAGSARAPYQADVLSRKLTVATGTGVVHGATFVLRNWGLAELPARGRGASPPPAAVTRGGAGGVPSPR
jgi:peptidoglycan hydrolase-like protein with peptidoglycan-binding domain